MILAQGFDDLRSSGVFKRIEDPRAGPCWAAERDVDTTDMKENWVEREFRAERGARLYAWAYLGGCCRETLQAYVQATEGTVERNGNATAIDPGSNMAAPLQLPAEGLAKTHAEHGGEKRPATWLWVEIPLPAYARSGAKVIRLLSDQKGFSVARLHVGPGRKPPPAPGK